MIDYKFISKLHDLREQWEQREMITFSQDFNGGYNMGQTKASEELGALIQEHYSLANEEVR